MPAERPDVELSVIVPCYNEEGNLPELVERTARVFERRHIRGELVLVNDASRDGTASLIEALAARHAWVVGVHHPTNRGISGGWRSGFDRSRGRWVCTIDADLQYQPEAIALLYREMSLSGADLVQGWRSTLERQHDHRYYWSRVLDYLLKIAFAMPEHDVKSGFVLYRREVFEDILREAGRFHYFQHMITVVAKAKGYTIRQVETLFAERHAGQSFIGGFPLTMMARTFVDIGRGVVAYRLREPKDPSLEPVVPAPDAPVPVRTGGAHRLRDPAITRNAAVYLDELGQTQWLPPAELRQLQLRRLRRLLAHATDHVGYWRERLAEAGVSADDVHGLEDLQRVPILGKDALRENLCFDLVSDGSDKRGMVKLTTSGATGEPQAVFVDRLQRDTRWANLMRHREWAGWRPGAPWVRIDHRLPLPSGTVPLRDRLRRMLAGSDVLVVEALDPAHVRELAERIRRLRPALVEADAEVLRCLAEMRPGAEDEPWAPALVSTGQTLDADLRALLARRLAPRVFDRYGAREVGPIAQQCEAGSWHVNAESLVVEIVRGDRAVAPGESGELVVTDLTNRCVPLLRYRVGDLAVMSERVCECGRGLPVLERVTGRDEHVVRARGERRVPAGVFADLFAPWEFAVERWRVVQTAPDRIVVQVARRPRFTRDTEEALRRALVDVIGPGVAVELEWTDPAAPADGAGPVELLAGGDR